MIVFFDNNTQSSYYDQIVQLEGVEYRFTFLWSERETCWYMDVADQDQNPLASGVKLVINTPLLRRFSDTHLPPGLLMCVDESGSGSDIGAPGDLGDRVQLVYFTSDDATLAA